MPVLGPAMWFQESPQISLGLSFPIWLLLIFPYSPLGSGIMGWSLLAPLEMGQGAASVSSGILAPQGS